MTWTYTARPDVRTEDKVRFLCGDTDHSDQLAQDGEIAYALQVQPTPEMAAAIVCEAISAKFARQADKTIGRLSISASQRATAYRERAAELRRNAAALALPVFGGLTISGKDVLDSDTDAVQPSFRIGQDDHPETIDERRSSLDPLRYGWQ